MKEYLKEKDDKINYLKGLIRMSKADGIFTESEKEFYHAAAAGLNLDQDTIYELEKVWNVPGEKIVFTSKESSVFFLQSAIQIAMIDEQYDEAEKKEIRRMAEELFLDEKTVSVFEQWVEEGLDWRKKGEKLIAKYSE